MNILNCNILVPSLATEKVCWKFTWDLKDLWLVIVAFQTLIYHVILVEAFIIYTDEFIETAKL